MNKESCIEFTDGAIIQKHAWVEKLREFMQELYGENAFFDISLLEGNAVVVLEQKIPLTVA